MHSLGCWPVDGYLNQIVRSSWLQKHCALTVTCRNDNFFSDRWSSRTTQTSATVPLQQATSTLTLYRRAAVSLGFQESFTAARNKRFWKAMVVVLSNDFTSLFNHKNLPECSIKMWLETVWQCYQSIILILLFFDNVLLLYNTDIVGLFWPQISFQLTSSYNIMI